MWVWVYIECALVNVSILRRSHPLPFIRSAHSRLGRNSSQKSGKCRQLSFFLINTEVDKCGEGEGSSISVSGHVWQDMFCGRMRYPRNGRTIPQFSLPVPWAHCTEVRNQFIFKILERQFCRKKNLEIWTRNCELTRLRKKQVVEKETYGWGGWPKTKCAP